MDKRIRAAIVEHLDMMARLATRADIARALGLEAIANGAEQDIERRTLEVERLKHESRGT